MTLASGSLFVANISSDGQTIYFDLFDSAHNLLSQSSVAPPLPPDQGIASLALADVNRDGKLDLIAVFAAGVWVATGNGDGTFQPGKSSTLPGSSSVPSSYAVALGDLNGDGVPDLVLSAASGGPFTIALGKGDGTFTERGSLSVPAFGLHSTTAAIADLNGDGKADLVLSGAGELIAVALGNGDGTFQAISLYSALNSSSGFSLASVAVGDVNGDGIPDIVTNGSILFGDGKGGFPSRRDYTSVAGGSVMLADFDGDGITDIIIGNGNPDFLSGAALNPSSSIGLQLCDYMNLSYFCPVEYSLAVLFGAGGGAFVAAPAVEVVDSGYYPSLASADFNGDGIPDLAVATFAVTTSANSISILEGKGNGEFSSGFTQSLGPSPVISPVAVAAADFNHDGRPDVAVLVALGASSEVQVFPGNGDGTLGAPVTVSIADIFVNSVAAPDVNGDGIPDLVVTSDIAVYVSLNKGDGTFSAPVMVSSIRSAIVGFGDFNGDGKLDIAVSASQTDNLVVLLGKGDGTFPNSVQSTLPFSEPAALAVADFNGDGKLDLALTFYGTIAVMFGQGNGGFSGYQLSPSGGGGLDPIFPADVNGDGILDLIASDPLSAYLGNGDGTFQAAVEIGSSFDPTSLVIADFNRDGRPDIAAALGAGVATFLNLSRPSPSLTVVSAASFALVPLAPDSFAAAFGLGMTGSAQPLAIGSLQGLTVSVEDSDGTIRSAAIYFASDSQINFLVPANTALGAATVTVTTISGKHLRAQIEIAAIAPALFVVAVTPTTPQNVPGAGASIAAAYVVYVAPGGAQTIEPVLAPENYVGFGTVPIDVSRPGETYLILFGTGFDAASAATTVATVQGVSVPVSYAGAQPTYAGLDQINLLLPPSLAGAGDVSVAVSIGGKAANTALVNIQ